MEMEQKLSNFEEREVCVGAVVVMEMEGRKRERTKCDHVTPLLATAQGSRGPHGSGPSPDTSHCLRGLEEAGSPAPPASFHYPAPLGLHSSHSGVFRCLDLLKGSTDSSLFPCASPDPNLKASLRSQPKGCF